MRRYAKAIVAVSAMLLTLALGVTLAGAVAPVVTIDPPSAVSYTSVHLSGTVDPQDQETSYRFQYSKDPIGEGWSDGAFQGPIAAGAGAQNVSEDLANLEPGTEYEVRLLAENVDGQTVSAEPNPTFTTDPVALPSVTIDPVSAITDDTAHFSGTIDPEAPAGNPSAFDVTWHFECTPACPNVEFENPGAPFPKPIRSTIPADSNPHIVSADADGLDPNTSYEILLVAENAGGSKTVSATFKTSASAPIVQTLPPAVITDTSAWIGAKVNPQNSATTYYIEYSSDPGFASSVKVPGTEDESAGSGNQLVLVNHHSEGLEPGTTYYYRVVASGAGTTIGDTESFETRAVPFSELQGLPDGRVYEKVSPSDKNGGEITAGTTSSMVAKAAEGGDAVAYGATGVVFAGDSGSIFPEYVARRGPGGWTTEGISPKVEPRSELALSTFFYWLSDDLSRGLVQTPAKLNDGDLNDSRNLYLRENPAGTYSSIINPAAEEGTVTIPRGISDDEDHVVYQMVSTSIPGKSDLWMWSSDGQHREVGVRPDGTSVPATLGALNPGIDIVSGENAISNDGSHVYFTAAQFPAAIYLRDFTGGVPSTTLVSGSERAGDDPNDPVDRSTFELASSDGEIAFFSSASQLLTDESDSGFSKWLYRWQADAPQGSRLTDITLGDPDGEPGFLGVAGSTDDASIVYFAATGKLTPDAAEGAANLYKWEEGNGLSLVARLRNDNIDQSVWGDKIGNGETNATGVHRQARMSPDGRFIAFVTQEALTAYDTNGTPQMYLYDSQSDSTTCVSCSLVEDKSQAGTWFSSSAFEVGAGDQEPCCIPSSFGELPRNLALDGSSIVFDSNDPLVPTDSNGRIDVYRWKDGELRLISTGSSGQPSRLLDVSADHTDIFFTTAQKLTPSDGDTGLDLYDAKVGGVAETVTDAPCVGDECQGTPSAPPSFSTPASAGFDGQGNERPRTRARCRKGKVRRSNKCVSRTKKRKGAKAARKTKQSKPGRSH